MTVDRMKKLDDLRFVENYLHVESYQQGIDEAEAFFKNLGTSQQVRLYGGKYFQLYDEERNVSVKRYVYECYIDAGSVDYFFFTYDVEL